MKNEIEKYTNEIAKNHNKIIDDFVKTYIASRWEDYFSKKKIDFKRVELVIQRKSAIETVYFCRLKKGKLSKKTNE